MSGANTPSGPQNSLKPSTPSDISQIHEMRHQVLEDVFYPAHPPRQETPEYVAVHHKLVVEDDTPCYICTLRHSQLNDPEINIHGARSIETHHWWIEWALANAVDPDKIRAFFPEADDVSAWVDHSPNNLLVLCDRHHRHKEVGIHELTYPIWIAQKFVKQDFRLTPD